MQMADSGHDREAQTIAGKASTPVAAIEPGKHFYSFRSRYPRTIVLHHNRHGIAILASLHSYGRLVTGVLESVIDEVSSCAGQQIFVSHGRRLTFDIRDQMDSLGFSSGIVKLNYVGHNLI